VNELKDVGVDEVMIYCVNDGAVMDAWATSQGVSTDISDGGLLHLFADPYGTVTEALGMSLTHSGPYSVGLVNRCKRFALYVVDGVVQIVRIAEGDGDPAGDDYPDITLAESMIVAIQEYNNNKSSASSSSSDEL
jgi:2-Cys peroxiredoxin 5